MIYICHSEERELHRVGYTFLFKWFTSDEILVSHTLCWIYLSFSDDLHPARRYGVQQCSWIYLSFLFQMIYILSNWNSLLYNYLRYLPSGIIPQHKGLQQPRWIFKSKDYHISRLHNYVCKRFDCECAAKLLKINKNKDIISYRFCKNWNFSLIMPY